MSSGINNKIYEFLCNSKNVKNRKNTRLEKCYGHVNIATAINKTYHGFHNTVTELLRNLKIAETANTKYC